MLFLPVYVTSGALMPLGSLPISLRGYFLYNPIAHLLELLRSALIGPAYQASPHVGWSLPILWALCLVLAALGLYRARRHRLQMG